MAKTINGTELKAMIIAGAERLREERERIDALNVFPVPDGDTGINMSLTALAAAKDLPDTKDIGAVAKAASGGSLRGARGNSGVILSQLFRGFAKALEGKTEAGAEDFAKAFARAAETAYKAVMKPKEGTMLTVAREMGERAAIAAAETDDPVELALAVLRHGDAVLARTPEMLPVLKQAGVVDAGGAGLLEMLHGAVASYAGATVRGFSLDNAAAPKAVSAIEAVSGEIVFAYCTEFFVTPRENADAARLALARYLETIGDSLVAVGDEEIVKIHVHTNNPGLALEKALSLGELSNLKIENMQLQHTSLLDGLKEQEPKPPAPEQPRRALAVVAVSSGAGFKELFESLGSEDVPVRVIEGGQTMNPSAEDIAGACAAANADSVIILPNNKNIVLAAQQAAYLVENTATRVVPTKNVPQGIAAALALGMDTALDKAADDMEAAIERVHTGQVTIAVRDTEIDGIVIKEGDWLCMLDGDIVGTAGTAADAAKDTLNRASGEDAEFITVYYGEGGSEAGAEDIAQYAKAARPDCEVETQLGGQPVYPYIIAVE